MKRTKYVYLAVFNDELSLSLCVCENYKKLSIWSGKTISDLRKNIFRCDIDYKNNCKYIKVFIPDIDNKKEKYEVYGTDNKKHINRCFVTKQGARDFAFKLFRDGCCFVEMVEIETDIVLMTLRDGLNGGNYN